jgi:hypothetical protein
MGKASRLKRTSPSRPTAWWKTPFSGPRALSGDITATVKVPVEPEESIAENNQRSFHISIRQEKLKVLVVDSLPRWEYRYLRNALARDPGVDMHCLLFHPEIGPGDGPGYIPAFPATKEALAPYDVIFLGDVGVGQNELTETNAAMIRGLVEQQASGLVFVPGQRGREASFLNSPLADLYPVAAGFRQTAGHRTAERGADGPDQRRQTPLAHPL